MSALEDIIKRQIFENGPIDISQFMALALSHPEHGYYVCRDPIGRKGDFVTAPEISQMFGEIIGAWAAHSWMQMGRPEAFGLVECGPGRGALMADVLRACSNVEGFVEAADIHLIEINKALRSKQAMELDGYQPQWHSDFGSIPSDIPIIVIANEFLDALPFRQLVFMDGSWKERVVGVQDDVFVFMSRPVPLVLLPKFGQPKEGDVYEFSSARINFVEMICSYLESQKGVAIFIDYGHGRSEFGDTFQAVKRHECVDVLSNVGQADLTSHVDFDVLYDSVEKSKCVAQPLITQGDFLKALGIEVRAEYLKVKGAKTVEGDLHRLISEDEMGAVFKVMDVRYGF
ncbi:MAG: class I SAM-dependent methyltransferase [Bdellovibrionales bacterium]